MRELSKAWVEENSNYEPGTGNLFLMASVYEAGKGYFDICIGGADRSSLGSGKWEVTVTKLYDEETDSDAMLIGTYDTQDEAKAALIEAQHVAYLG